MKNRFPNRREIKRKIIKEAIGSRKMKNFRFLMLNNEAILFE